MLFLLQFLTFVIVSIVQRFVLFMELFYDVYSLFAQVPVPHEILISMGL